MTMYEERDSYLKLTTSAKKRTVAAPWFLTGMGDPYQMDIPENAKACYDPRQKILHIREPERGSSTTITPSVRVRIDHAEDFHDIEFIDLEDPTKLLAGIYINEGVLSFEDKQLFAFSNTLMFQSLCRFLASPVFNPWVKLPHIQNDRAFYQCNLEAGELWLNPEIEGATVVDRVHSEITYLTFEISTPLPAWNKDTRQDDMLPPGRYDAEVIKADHDTGDVITVRADGWIKDGTELCTFHIPFAPLYERMQDGTAPAGAFSYRIPFDPREHTDLALRAAAPQAKTGLFRKLLGN
ncbi:hypothetical protein [Shimia sp. MMG029]|uniref:hypothetical protein n=1 Tax=Shimia sp. MMG029 TaxID=3021978 RepID=UPI0022FE2BFE|nr:hypothetical protein [Shimia sp. MMG029]MDA5555798.1 hypothetical protein [Shimia sp. MMG029]